MFKNWQTRKHALATICYTFTDTLNVDCILSKLYANVISCPPAPRHGVLHDPVPADSQSGEEVQCLKGTDLHVINENTTRSPQNV